MTQTTAKKCGIWLALTETVVATIMIFLGWCIIDYIEVKQPDYPVRIHERDGLIAILPIPAFTSAALLDRWRRGSWDLFMPLIATLVAIPLSVPIIFYLGIPFHLSIGGTLSEYGQQGR